MMTERWIRVKTLLAEAAGRPPAERAAFLEQAAAGDEALRAEVERLLVLGAEAGAYFDTLGLAVGTGGGSEERARGRGSRLPSGL